MMGNGKRLAIGNIWATAIAAHTMWGIEIGFPVWAVVFAEFLWTVFLIKFMLPFFADRKESSC